MSDSTATTTAFGATSHEPTASASSSKPKAILSHVASTIKWTVSHNKTELEKWRQTFDAFAKVELDGKK
jgi:hypothetical protein